mmetsp:Transcript_70680/g.124535  ORF Transcript_70680/g.124535 Transcript_70680/m.124535 type:complete len:80 (-) Transcript_70680:566-805(-)
MCRLFLTQWNRFPGSEATLIFHALQKKGSCSAGLVPATVCIVCVAAMILQHGEGWLAAAHPSPLSCNHWVLDCASSHLI